MRDCAGQADQHELARLVDGPNTRARLAYTVKGQMSDSDRAAWRARLTDAHFEATARP